MVFCVDEFAGEIRLYFFVRNFAMTDVSLESEVFAFSISPNQDIRYLKEYIFKNNAKDFVFIDALEILDTIRFPKFDPETPEANIIEISSLVSKAIKASIDQNIAKSLDIKKKSLIAAEKPKKEKNPPPPPPIYFGGQTETVIALLNWPLVPMQLEKLNENDVKVAAFVNLIVDKPPTPHPPIADKKRPVPLPYIKIAEKTVPETNIPLSWVNLQEKSDLTTIFTEIKLSEDPAEAWNTLQLEIAKILDARKSIVAETNETKFLNLPIVDVIQNVDLEYYNESLKNHENNFVNAIFENLKKNEFDIFERDEITDSDIIDDMFYEYYKKYSLEQESAEIPAEIFGSFPSPSYYITNLINSWSVCPQNTESTVKAIQYYSTIEGFSTAAGQQFDLLVSKVNKQYSLGLPINYYDFTKFTKMINYSDCSSVVDSILRTNNIVDHVMDPATGIVYLLALPPGQKTLGKPIQYKLMPTTMQSGSEYYKVMIDNTDSSQEKKLKINSISNVVKNNENPSGLFQSVREQIKSAKNVYNFPSSFNFSSDFVSPYFFRDNLRADVCRELWNSTYLFKYKVFSNDFDVAVENDAISVDFGALRLCVNSEATTIFHKSSVYFIKDKKLIINKNIILDQSGDFVLQENRNMFMSDINGFVGYKTPEKYIYNYKDATGNEKIHKRTDYVHKKCELIRDDDVKYTINLKDKSRIIKIKKLELNQTDSKQEIAYKDIKLQSDGKSIQFKLGEYNFTYSDSLCIEFDGCSMNISDHIEAKKGETEFIIKFNELQIKDNQKVLFANSQGDERLSDLATTEPNAKKRVEYIQTNWGLLMPCKDVLPENILVDLQKKFPPRFLAIRPDLSATEFCRPEFAFDMMPPSTEKLQNPSYPSESQKITELSLVESDKYDEKKINQYMCKADAKIIPDGCELFQVKTFVKNDQVVVDVLIDEFMRAKSFVSFTPLDKSHRTSALKEFSAPRQKKAKKDKEEKQESEKNDNEKTIDAISKMNSFFMAVSNALAEATVLAIQKWQESRIPQPPRHPDLERIPPQTPPPNVLIAAKLRDSNFVNVSNFWESPEANFVYVRDYTVKPPRPPSARTRLFDPPRHFTTLPRETPESTEYDGEELQKPSPPTRTFETQLDDTKTPQSSRAPRRHGRTRRVMSPGEHSQHVDFGEVPAGKSASASVEITNTGFVPLRYTITQPADDRIRILTAPGIVMAGFKLKIRLQLNPSERGEISTTFRLVTPEVDMEIPVSAIIV